MDVSKSSTSAYPTNPDPQVQENIKRYWEEVSKAKIEKLKKELE